MLPDQADHSRPAAISIGHTPTFEDAGLKVEAFLLEYQGRLTGQPMRLEFVGRLREQRRFESADELVAQIRRDVEQVRTRTAACDPALGAAVES
jgi:riboflavin kinase/FMN adenylyltransferase